MRMSVIPEATLVFCLGLTVNSSGRPLRVDERCEHTTVVRARGAGSLAHHDRLIHYGPLQRKLDTCAQHRSVRVLTATRASKPQPGRCIGHHRQQKRRGCRSLVPRPTPTARHSADGDHNKKAACHEYPKYSIHASPFNGRLTVSLSGRLSDRIARHARTIDPARIARQFRSHGRSKRCQAASSCACGSADVPGSSPVAR